MFLSIVIPIFNKEKFLERCVESLNKSIRKETVEVIFVDDASTDASLDLLFQLDKKVNFKYKVFRLKENSGTYLARAKGIKNCCGDYILFLDPDDELVEESIDILVGVLEKGNIDILIYDHLVVKDSYVEKKASFDRKSNLKNINGAKEFLKINSSCQGAGGKVFSRKVAILTLEQIGYEAKNFINSEDYLFVLVAACNSNKILYLRKYLYIYHKNDEGASNPKQSDFYERYYFQIEIFSRLLSDLIDSKPKKINAKNMSVLNKVLRERISSKYLMIRNRTNVRKKIDISYYMCLRKAFFANPSFKVLTAIALYLLSFGKVKV